MAAGCLCTLQPVPGTAVQNTARDLHGGVEFCLNLDLPSVRTENSIPMGPFQNLGHDQRI